MARARRSPSRRHGARRRPDGGTGHPGRYDERSSAALTRRLSREGRRLRRPGSRRSRREERDCDDPAGRGPYRSEGTRVALSLPSRRRGRARGRARFRTAAGGLLSGEPGLEPRCDRAGLAARHRRSPPTSSSTTGHAGALAAQRRRCWRPVAGPWPVYLGYAGLSAHHLEGDGTTPTGAFAIGPVMYGVAPDPGVHTAYHRLVCGDWWDEDPSSADYNTFQHVPCGATPPFGGASEALWRSTRAYAHFVFVEYNARPGRPRARFGDLHPRRARPSDERLHLASRRASSLQLVRWLRPAAAPARS